MNARLSIRSILLITCALAACDGSDDGDQSADAALEDARVGEMDASGGDAQTDGSYQDAEGPSDADADASDGATDAAMIDAGMPSTSCDAYEAPFDRTSDDGKLVARFVAIEPELYYRGQYDWTIELRTPSGEEVTGAEVEAKGFMPAHGHGTTPITVRHEAGSARYELRGVNLFMAGKWEVRVTVQSAAGDDRAVFRACVRDRPDAGDSDAGDPDAGDPDAGDPDASI